MNRKENDMSLQKVRVSIDGLPENTILDAYTDFSYWNGWLNVSITRAELEKYMSESPYDVRFLPNGTAILYFEDEMRLESVPVETVDGIQPLYDMNGFCFSELDEGE